MHAMLAYFFFRFSPTTGSLVLAIFCVGPFPEYSNMLDGLIFALALWRDLALLYFTGMCCCTLLLGKNIISD